MLKTFQKKILFSEKEDMFFVAKTGGDIAKNEPFRMFPNFSVEQQT